MNSLAQYWTQPRIVDERTEYLQLAVNILYVNLFKLLVTFLFAAKNNKNIENFTFESAENFHLAWEKIWFCFLLIFTILKRLSIARMIDLFPWKSIPDCVLLLSTLSLSISQPPSVSFSFTPFHFAYFYCNLQLENENRNSYGINISCGQPLLPHPNTEDTNHFPNYSHSNGIEAQNVMFFSSLSTPQVIYFFFRCCCFFLTRCYRCGCCWPIEALFIFHKCLMRLNKWNENRFV